MTKEQLKERFKQYAINVAFFVPSFERQITPIYSEGNELLSIIVASLNTLRKKQTNRKNVIRIS